MNVLSKTKGRVEDEDKVAGQRLRFLRKVNNMTQEGLAQKLGITFQQVQKYEQGVNRISFGKLAQILKIFDVPSSYFFEEQKNIKTHGFGENNQQPFEEETGSATNLSKTSNEDLWHSVETANLLKAYYSILDTKARKNVLKMVKSIANAQNPN